MLYCEAEKSIQMYDNFSSALPIDDRNERPLLVALIAIVAAWSIVFLLGSELRTLRFDVERRSRLGMDKRRGPRLPQRRR